MNTNKNIPDFSIKVLYKSNIFLHTLPLILEGRELETIKYSLLSLRKKDS